MCKCEERKAELAARGAQPLIGEKYTPIDAVQYAVMKAFDKVLKRW